MHFDPEEGVYIIWSRSHILLLEDQGEVCFDLEELEGSEIGGDTLVG